MVVWVVSSPRYAQVYVIRPPNYSLYLSRAFLLEHFISFCVFSYSAPYFIQQVGPSQTTDTVPSSATVLIFEIINYAVDEGSNVQLSILLGYSIYMFFLYLQS